MKTGTFGESGRFQVPNDTLSDETKKRRPIFYANIPQNSGLRVCFMRLPLLGEFSANLCKSHILDRF